MSDPFVFVAKAELESLTEKLRDLEDTNRILKSRADQFESTITATIGAREFALAEIKELYTVQSVLAKENRRLRELIRHALNESSWPLVKTLLAKELGE